MDCKDERAPHHMRMAKTGDQRVAVKFFGTAHPDHTVKRTQIIEMKETNKKRAEKKRAHEIDEKLKKMHAPPITSRLKWWARDALAEPDTSVQRVHPLMCAPEPVENRSPASSPKSLALRDAAGNPDEDAPVQVTAIQLLNNTSWREPEKRPEKPLPPECSANKEIALAVARQSRGRHKDFLPQKSNTRRNSTLQNLADSHTSNARGTPGTTLKALTNG